MDLKMLSRAGKSTDEKYAILKKKDEIVSGHNKKFVVKSQFSFLKKEVNEDFFDKFKLLQIKKTQEL
jgi:hypothetical protein